MFKILSKKRLNENTCEYEILAPLAAKKCKAGQFIILRVDEDGERIPLTVADFDRAAGSVTIMFQIVGATTERLNRLTEGDCLHDFVGPLGRATETDGKKKVAVVVGGVLLAGLYALFNTTIIPTLTAKITEMFSYSGT